MRQMMLLVRSGIFCLMAVSLVVVLSGCGDDPNVGRKLGLQTVVDVSDVPDLPLYPTSEHNQGIDITESQCSQIKRVRLKLDRLSKKAMSIFELLSEERERMGVSDFESWLSRVGNR